MSCTHANCTMRMAVYGTFTFELAGILALNYVTKHMAPISISYLLNDKCKALDCLILSFWLQNVRQPSEIKYHKILKYANKCRFLPQNWENPSTLGLITQYQRMLGTFA